MPTELANLFAIEGLDGVGKSTIVAGLAERHFTVLATPPTSFKKFRPFFEHTDLRLRFLYYLLGVYSAGKQARRVPSWEKVISDRYLLTTLSAHEAMGLPVHWIDLCKPIIHNIAVPTNTFLVTCDETERMRRMTRRGANSIDLSNLRINNKIHKGYIKWAERLNHRLTLVDTTNESPTDTISKLVRLAR
ncbi:hypothetical protein A2631_00410 [Candidatus Daviesbacteria bacterium RIFCSPHIGHO2_01_FULL_44_29]|uniref:Thymidylate kinase-like domain-containing protein n=1 Tax=Candidatus Daviesbacteria bacterium RIFCSPHIGHO2_02_FULL_43_12 TaxID=1797776 RepID=A0A1F5KJA7_9BACT|nr:MAG: hypothetical protein A2631_00410 [Candidatus Daviesbacteria bacterium RIFCSPHIGHO2_01_FULL_44_29]OGE40895.1 MAG: hypothetical protein A3D25_03160 [Candidatus Daviesbacteria bacterium RIFCSPHIGHO2_02_FULL_43_12]OGE70047.1 MAG: hypothetical protein A3B55_02510 [Candidatus Daviesbacteria bacterium RIFCSPLOWO2_01_FULL_43_15]